MFNTYKTSELASASVLEMGTIYRAQQKYDNAINIYNSGISDLKNQIKFLNLSTIKE